MTQWRNSSLQSAQAANLLLPPEPMALPQVDQKWQPGQRRGGWQQLVRIVIAYTQIVPIINAGNGQPMQPSALLIGNL